MLAANTDSSIEMERKKKKKISCKDCTIFWP